MLSILCCDRLWLSGSPDQSITITITVATLHCTLPHVVLMHPRHFHSLINKNRHDDLRRMRYATDIRYFAPPSPHLTTPLANTVDTARGGGIKYRTFL